MIEEETSIINCPACGTLNARDRSLVCHVCGKLKAEGYMPLDTIRSSHYMQRKSVLQVFERRDARDLFEQNKNHVSQTAWACVVYSLVPYLGMLFIPFAVFAGGFGYYLSLRRPQLGGRRLAAICVSVSFVILTIQLLLWWLLYLIPGLSVPGR